MLFSRISLCLLLGIGLTHGGFAQTSPCAPPEIDLGKEILHCSSRELTLAVTLPGVEVTWEDGSHGKKHLVHQSGLYSVRVRNRCGEVRDSVWVRMDACVCEGVIKKEWYPNSCAGGNELMMPNWECLEVSNFNFSIFNRWGEEMFSTRSKAEGWDGNFRGNPVAMGTFVWLIRYEDPGTGERKKMGGNFVLLR